MRAIKFRGKSLKYGNWLYGSLWLGGDNAYIIHERPVEKAGEMMWHDTYVTEVTPDTIGQHTGLKDANGKEIYEGDILRDSSGFTAVVVAYKGAFRLLDNKFKKLISSILIFPKMLDIRPIVVDDTMVALGGNMRYRALVSIADMDINEVHSNLEQQRAYRDKTKAEKEALLDYWAKWLDNPTATIIKASELTDSQKSEFIIKDNVGFGN